MHELSRRMPLTFLPLSEGMASHRTTWLNSNNQSGVPRLLLLAHIKALVAHQTALHSR